MTLQYSLRNISETCLGFIFFTIIYKLMPLILKYITSNKPLNLNSLPNFGVNVEKYQGNRSKNEILSERVRDLLIRKVDQNHRYKQQLNYQMIKFLLMVNKQGQTRLAKYYNQMTVKERTTLQGQLVRKCLSRNETLCSFIEYRGYKVIYRRYASLYFIVGLDLEEQNEMAYLEFIHNLVETMDKYFQNVCQLDIMYNIEKAHYILDEMIMNGQIVETNKTLILAPLYVLDKIQE